MTGETRIRISLLTPSFQGGGAERVMLNLANGFARKGVRVDLVAVSATGPFKDQIDPGIRVVDLASPRVLRALPRLVRYLRREKPQAVFSALDYINVAAVLANALAGSPSRVVVSTHKFFSLATAQSPLFRDRWILPSVMRVAYRKAHGIVAVAEGLADDLSSSLGIPRSRVTVIPNPVVSNRLLTMAKVPADHKWLIDSGPPVILGIGRLHKEKDFPTLLRAFAILRKATPVRLILLGEGPERPALEECIDKLGIGGAVDLPGFVANPYTFLARAQLFVLSSRNEGLPTVLIEAMACGCPVVSTDCPSGPREILEGGVFGALSPVGDARALAVSMEATLSSPLASEVLKERAGRYHVDAAIRRYLTLLHPSSGEAEPIPGGA